MSSVAKPKMRPAADFQRRFRAALSAFADHPGELGLRRAYELGRRALEGGKSLIEVATLHQEAVADLIAESKDPVRSALILRNASEFLRETLSPYEMGHRGFQEAVQALRQVNQTLESEISRIAYAVHDESSQMLVAVHLALAELSRDLPKPQQDQIYQIEQILSDVEKRLRRYSHELRPTILDDLGWVPAIRFLAEGVTKRSSLPIHIDSRISGRLPRPIETALYRVLQEALTNITKHANATAVWIQIRREGSSMACSVRDDGKGFDTQALYIRANNSGLGLLGMRERLNSIGGTLFIESSPGNGTRLTIRVPLEKEQSSGNPSVTC